MALGISFPFRLLPNGSVATVEQRSDAGVREGVVHLILTRPGERRLQPGFGMPDPTFTGFEPTVLGAALAVHGPPVRVIDVAVEPVDPNSQLVTIELE